VADLLWPDADGDAAQQALSTTLHRLRQLLGRDDAIRRQAGRLRLGRKHIWLDVWAVDHLLAQAERDVGGSRVTDESWARSATLTERAVRLYGGDFLGDDPECPWAARQAERIRHRFLAQLQAIARHWQARGEPERVVECYRRALDIHPCSEECCRALMQAYQHLGRRDEALSVYTRCTTLLQETLGIHPSPQTVAILQTLKTS
jgi:LuxR family transcriptional regulator, maltose regulon positive regulatory protein